MKLLKEIGMELQSFCQDEDGITVIEVVLILVVAIGLVVIFKGSITKLLNNIFSEINKQTNEVY